MSETGTGHTKKDQETRHEQEENGLRLDKLQMFEGREIRSVWVEDEEAWYFSIVDVVSVLTESKNPQTYWRVLKKRLSDEGNQTVTNCNGLKMRPRMARCA
ncbi:hypothetical protein [Eggerthella sinensis]|uniref:hypothetical protein n=1 Tax=Eggerthella sinensis TaxID=242230 RepID=UPI0022E87F43|nr:hypothetical protein [Eggerthella sinensis]